MTTNKKAEKRLQLIIANAKKKNLHPSLDVIADLIAETVKHDFSSWSKAQEYSRNFIWSHPEFWKITML